MKRESKWLDTELNLNNDENEVPDKIKQRGRPLVPFGLSSPDSKHRKIAKTLIFNTPERIKESGLYAIKKQDGIDIQKVADYMKQNNISASEMVNAHKSSKSNFDPLQSLKLSVSCKLTKRPYEILQSSLSNLKNTKILASYSEMNAQKKQSYPENIVSGDLEVYTDVRSVLEKFIERYYFKI